jgi:hypothetical protein
MRFRLPEPVLNSPEGDQAPGAWLSHGDAESSVMMQVPPLGAFVRALLPIRLTGGHKLTYGVWVGIHPDDLQRTFAVWWEPEYKNLRLDGYLANSVKPWGMLGAPVSMAVLDPEQTPYCTESTDPVLARVLADEWPHEEVLGVQS